MSSFSVESISPDDYIRITIGEVKHDLPVHLIQDDKIYLKHPEPNKAVLLSYNSTDKTLSLLNFSGSYSISVLPGGFPPLTPENQLEVNSVEAQLDEIYRTRRLVGINTNRDLYFQVIQLPSSADTIRIMKKFTYLNCYPIKYNTGVYESFQ